MDIREMTEKKVFSYMEGHLMVSPPGRIVAGVSGGADSVCLLFLLLAYAERAPLSLAVVHVNHGLRPDADQDAQYVEELCRGRGIPFFLENVDVHKLALGGKCSLEDAGRRARYEAFGRAAEGMGGAKVAVAHNSDDNAETMLFHLFRGSGMKGLCGIAPVRRDAALGLDIIRPILCLERREVEAYLRERGIPWRTDGTNGGDEYTRNRIRHHILPYAEREIVRGVVGHMCRTADILRETEGFLEEQTREALGRCLVPADETMKKAADMVWRFGSDGRGGPEMAGDGGCHVPDCYVLDIEAFRACHGVLQKRMLLALANRLSPTGKDISAVHVRDMLTLFEGEANRSVSLPFGIAARRQYENVILEIKGNGGGDVSIGRGSGVAPMSPWDGRPIMAPPLGEMLDAPFVYDLKGLGRIEFTVLFIKKGQEVPKNQYTKWFDCDKIEESVVIRSRCAGDYLTISDGTGKVRHKSLKDYMIAEKIPREFRDSIPVAAAGNHILWLIGWRISEHFKVDGNTNRVLQISCK